MGKNLKSWYYSLLKLWTFTHFWLECKLLWGTTVKIWLSNFILGIFMIHIALRDYSWQHFNSKRLEVILSPPKVIGYIILYTYNMECCIAKKRICCCCSVAQSCPLNNWCHPTISSSAILFSSCLLSFVPFSSCLLSFPVLQSFPVNWVFTLGSQSIGASASASVLPMIIQDWFPLGLTLLVSLLSKGSQESSPTPQFKSIMSMYGKKPL